MKKISKLLSILLVFLLLVGCSGSGGKFSGQIEKAAKEYKQSMKDLTKDLSDYLGVESGSKEMEVMKELIDMAIDFDVEIVDQEVEGDFATVYVIVKTYDLEKFVETVEDQVDLDDFSDNQAISLAKSLISSFKKQGKTKQYPIEFEFIKIDGKFEPNIDFQEAFMEALEDNLSELF